MKFALRGSPFAVCDLPGQLDEPGKLVLVKRLIREGLLVRAEGGSAASAYQAAKPALVA